MTTPNLLKPLTKRKVAALAVLCLGLASGSTAAEAVKPFSVLSPVSAPVSNCATAADLNNDGKLDLICIVPGKDPVTGAAITTLEVLLGNGDGSFQPQRGVRVPDGTGGVGTADFNGDGRLDVAYVAVAAGTALGSGDLVVLPGNGDGTFGAAVHTLFAAGTFQSGSLLIADLNRDGRPDVLNSNFAFLGKGDGTFQGPLSYGGFAITFADVDGDGNLDVIGPPVSDPARSLSLFLGRGDGSFAAGRPIAVPANSVFACAQCVIAADFNSDGKIDLIAGQQGAANSVYASPFVEMYILLGNGDGTFQKPVTFAGLGYPLAAADVNQDGYLDLISGTAVLPGRGDGTFADPVFLAMPSYTCPLLPRSPFCSDGGGPFAIGDINGDGLPDLIVSYRALLGSGAPETSLLIFLNDSPGDGLIVPGVSAASGRAPVGFGSLVTAYGVNLAPVTAAASAGPPYPSTLGGISVHIGQDLAPLLFVSPTQVNYLLPAPSGNTAYSAAVGIERNGQPFVEKGVAIFVVRDSPGFFTVDGSGVAAATAVRVAANGTQTPVPVFDCGTSPCVPVPIDTGGDPVYLSLYGTGMADLPFNELSGTLACDVTGAVTYSGPQGQVPGLQQVNIKLGPASALNPVTGISCAVSLAQSSGYAFPILSNTVYVSVK